MYLDDTHQQFHVIPWDLNNSLGCYPFQSTSQSTYLDPFHRAWDAKYPLVQKLIANPDWKKRYTAHFRRAWKSFYNLKTLKPKIAQWRRLIDNEVRNDPKAIYSFRQYSDNFTKNTKVEIWFPGLEPFIAQRDYNLSTRDALKSESAKIRFGGMNDPEPSTPVHVWAVATDVRKIARMSVYWRTTGAWRRTDMFDDGKHGDVLAGDGIFAVQLPAQKGGARIQHYFEAENSRSAGGTYGYLPGFGSFKPMSKRVDWKRGVSPIQIHELLAKNSKGLKDSAGEREDWIELCNTGRSLVNLGGYYLTDNLDRPTKWKIPTGTLLPGGRTLLIWADEDARQGPLHANFKLSSDGETLALFGPDGETLLDRVSFGTPSPNSANRFTACGQRSYNTADSNANPMRLVLSSTPKAGTFSTLSIYGAPAGSWIVVSFAAAPGNLALPAQFGGSRLLLNSQVLAAASARANARGELKALLSYPNASAGVHMCLQAFAVRSDLSALGSNGVEVRPCK